MNSSKALRLVAALLGLTGVDSARASAQSADWLRVEKETEEDGKLRSGVTACKLPLADFSKLK